MRIELFSLLHPTMCQNLNFCSKESSFLKLYNKEMKSIPLRDAVNKSICDETNFLGEGSSKKGYNFVGLKDYVIRVYKKHFKNSDLEQEFVKPKRGDFLSVLDGVVLTIPSKIDIVKKKLGVSVGINNYSDNLHIDSPIPLNGINLPREETLKSLALYENLKDFPVDSYKQVYKQLRKFCSREGFQFDIVSPNNILVDIQHKKINIIDPVIPSVNEPVHGYNTNFAHYHGCDSLYPTLCDFLMHKEHFANLTESEKHRWINAINIIIAKCITAGESIGLERNTDKLRILYERIENFWKTDEVCKRYDNFMNLYSGAVNFEKTASDAIEHTNSVKNRIDAINRLSTAHFNQIKPTLEKILEAPHQPKVEFPEILNAVLDKIATYNKEGITIIPSVEVLFDKEIFPTTKKRLYNLFINLEPKNKRFLEEITKSASNPIEKSLYRNEFKNLFKSSKNLQTKKIYKTSQQGEVISDELAGKLWISRTCVNTSSAQKIAIQNMITAYKYIEDRKEFIPDMKDLVKIHKIVFNDIPNESFLAGKLRTPDTDALIQQVFKIKKQGTKLVNDYSASKDVIEDMKKLDKYIIDNYQTEDTFLFAANVFEELIRIHPFINGNGRAVRLFTEQLLLNKGFRLTRWPEETLYRKIYTVENLAEILRTNSKPIQEV